MTHVENRRWKIVLCVLGLTAGAATIAADTASHPDQEFLDKAAQAFNEVARKSLPAVVSVSAVRRADQSLAQAGLPFGQMPPGMGGPGMDEPFSDPTQPMMGLGSGIVIRSSGLVLTNNHVVENAEKVTVSFDEKRKYKAKVLGTDAKTDLALLQLLDAPKDLPTLSFGNSDSLQVGDWAIAIGSPFGLNQSVSFGIISAKGRAHMGILDIEDFIQTDAAINPGSSGGPLLNSKGEIIGVNTAIFSQGGGFMGIGFAVPAKIAKEVADQLVSHGKVARGWIGLVAQDMDKDLAKFFKTPQDSGALISEVASGGPAHKATLKPGDVVLKYDSSDVRTASDLKSLVGKTKAGANVALEIVREGTPKRINVAILEQPTPPSERPLQQAGQAAPGVVKKKGPTMGLTIEDVPAEIARFLHMSPKTGVLVTGVEAGSAAFEAGLEPGDIILSAGKQPVHSRSEFHRAVKDMKDEDVSVLYVQRGPEEKVYVPIKNVT